VAAVDSHMVSKPLRYTQRTALRTASTHLPSLRGPPRTIAFISRGVWALRCRPRSCRTFRSRKAAKIFTCTAQQPSWTTRRQRWRRPNHRFRRGCELVNDLASPLKRQTHWAPHGLLPRAEGLYRRPPALAKRKGMRLETVMSAKEEDIYRRALGLLSSSLNCARDAAKSSER
jgi:hypothetical protein